MDGATSQRKALFLEHVGKQMPSAELAHMLLPLFDQVPFAFWSAPASSSGRHHPVFALGNGGVVRHTVACMFIAADLAQAYGLTSVTDLCAIAFGAAYHDTFKGGDTGDGPWLKTEDHHPQLASQRIFAARDYNRSTEEQSCLVHAGWAVRDHMNAWGTRVQYIDKLSPWSQVVATADYMASRKYLEPTGELAELLEVFR